MPKKSRPASPRRTARRSVALRSQSQRSKKLSSKFWYLGILLAVIIFAVASKIIAPVALSHKDDLHQTSFSEDFDISQTQAVFNNQALTVPAKLAVNSGHNLPSIFGETVQDGSDTVVQDSTQQKTIEIDLADQRLYMKEGEEIIDYFQISSGKWGRTPTGEFDVWIKIPYAKMSGGSRALGTYFYLPNVPSIMFFYNESTPKHVGYAIHGAYWHNNFGVPMSHGCINLRPEDAEVVYAWATPEAPAGKTTHATTENPGTKIKIYGTAPYM
jgi:lipoprotein-anchoring transpeptidase ErfK/SrfK